MEEELAELQRDYLRDVHEKIAVIKQHAQGLRRKQQFKISFPVLLFLSHQLKGSGGSLGFPEISRIAREMTGILNSYLEDEEARPSPDDLGASIEALSSQLEQSARLP